MNWVKHFQLFLFDFDGLLVNTEELHFQAYINMCANRGFKLNWSFERYSEAAHHSSTGLQEQIYDEFPALYKQEPNWKILYEEKKRAFLSLIEKGGAALMPGVYQLLQQLDEFHIRRCVVTHSPLSLVMTIKKFHPILNSIPNWITREDYQHPKPHPECYQIAIQKYALPNDHIIGFEDSPRGLAALRQTSAFPVLICPPEYNYVDEIKKQNIKYFCSFNEINENTIKTKKFKF